MNESYDCDEVILHKRVSALYRDLKVRVRLGIWNSHEDFEIPIEYDDVYMK